MKYKVSLGLFLITSMLIGGCAKPPRIIPIADALTISCEMPISHIAVASNLWEDLQLAYSYCAVEKLLPPGEDKWFPDWETIECPGSLLPTVHLNEDDFMRVIYNLQMCEEAQRLRYEVKTSHEPLPI